jgi:hypothetical protein
MMVIGFTLGRYLSRRFLGTIMAVFGTVLALIVTIDFVELMRRAGDAEGASAQTMASLALLRAPSVAEQVLPFAVLFGAIAALLLSSASLASWSSSLPGQPGSRPGNSCNRACSSRSWSASCRWRSTTRSRPT